MIFDSISLAVKNLRKRGVRSWLTILGIFIGIAAVVSLISLGNGLQTAITGQFSTLDTDKLIIQNAATGFGPPGSTAVSKLTSHDDDLIKSVNGVKVTVPRLIRVVKVEYNKVQDFRYITSLPKEQEQIDVVYDALNVDVAEGRLLTRNDRGKVVLGNDFTDDSFEKPVEIGKKIMVQGKPFEVVGILKKASTFTINSVIIMPEDDMKDILNIPDEYDLIVAQVPDTKRMDQVTLEIQKKFRADRKEKEGEEDFSVQTPSQGIQTVNTILTVINLIVASIAAISLIVGGVGIMNTMYTSVLERTREIGVMKAVGAKNKDILTIFLVESALLGFIGGIVGAAIGLGLAYAAAAGVTAVFPGLPFNVTLSIPLLALAVSFSLVIGSLSGIFPALQASRLEPVEALRK